MAGVETWRVLLLDEPTASLDRQAIADVSTWISSLHEAGYAVVLSAHQPSVLTERCDEYWCLEQRCLQVSVFKQGRCDAVIAVRTW